ncbi:hypothetical protein BU26DRAFT_570602 [Trematosphaeria pertusa]|uniref:Probable double zinc ribbon domain-containing protein n=1 Tax=Trematosphaeria pertusa TaxID=390896 RepID=A0A6A6HXL9_9PLEO|nr:uncharacterized protein BU26DRAFT_570602 [Trematosphaeria pertusa]KAF2242518.1 hypothetical protein BU26DRAFT_570602 [Trematosphaeria pertusa]
MPASASVPTLHIQRPSDESDNIQEHVPLTIAGDWHCCKCQLPTPIYLRAGPHPLGALACECPHKPCGNCTLTSDLVKQFLPIDEAEPAVIPASPTGQEVPFGSVCTACGLSWRAREISRHKKSLRKMPSLSLAQRTRNRLAPEGGRLRKTQSSHVLGNKRIITPPGVGKQAEFAAVEFTGRECTCGWVMDLGALCFQIVEPRVGEEKEEQKEELKEALEEEQEEEPRNAAVWSTTPELEAMGHGHRTLVVRGVEHPNPLRSCPVTRDDI